MISKSELKFIRSLKIKKYRQAASAFLIEGEKNVLELIQSDFNIQRIVGTDSFFQAHPECKNHENAVGASSKEVADMSSFKSNESVIAVAEMKTFDQELFETSKFILALDGLSDPGNLGTIIRTADWFGFDQIVCSLDSVDLYNPKVISATMGSFTRIKVAYCDLPSYLKKYNGIAIGAEMNGEPLNKIPSNQPIIIVMGSESHGISPTVKKELDFSVTIPRFGGAESLNVGIATGILCHHMASLNP